MKSIDLNQKSCFANYDLYLGCELLSVVLCECFPVAVPILEKSSYKFECLSVRWECALSPLFERYLPMKLEALLLCSPATLFSFYNLLCIRPF